MIVCGINKTTLLDYPGRVACTIFLGGCNFRCPFCQNSSLVLDPAKQVPIPEEEIFSFLKKRQGILDGVCISGGEPTIDPSLPDLLRKIRELGYDIKLDTNGSRPETVKSLYREGLISKVAMDIKACPDNYAALTGLSLPDTGALKETAAFLMNSGIEYEFRTTVVRELHTERDFEEIASWLSGAEEYYLQAYRDSDTVIRPGFTACTEEEMQTYRDILGSTMTKVEIRGMD